MLVYSYIIRLYLKNFFIVLSGLELFFIGIDFLQKAKQLPDSASLKILYIFYTSIYALNFTVLISIILAFIIMQINLVRSNQLVALLSLGYSYSKLIKPVIVAIISIIALHISSNFSDLAYSKQKSELILKGEFFESFRDDLLLKHNNSYIYFKRFYPINKRAEEVKIFTIENRDLSSIVVAKEATFDGDSWILKDALVVDKPTDLTQNDVKLEQKRLESFKFLEGFRPKIIDSVYHIKANFSITDALYAIKLLQSQNINTQRIQAILVSTFLMPFFSLFMVIILFYVGPIFKRYSNLVLFSSLSIFFTLLFWGLLFTLSKLIISSAMPIEFLILFIAGFATVAFVLYIRRD